MLAHRIIPTILHKRGQMVKGVRFEADRVIGRALQAARIHAVRGVDELCILDVTATKEGREPDYRLVEELSEGCFAPLTIGGGIKSVSHVKRLLESGADKVCIGADKGKPLFNEVSEKFGRQVLVVSLDYSSNLKPDAILNTAIILESWGIGEILLQSIDCDGTQQGYDLDTIESVSDCLDIPVIASGGCKDYQNMVDAIKAGASAVAAGALFQFTDATPQEAARYLKEAGIEVRECA